MSFAAITMFVLFFVWTFLGMPLGHAMLAAGIVYFLVSGGDLGLVASQSLNGVYGNFVMLAVPLFIFSAELMNAGEMTDKLFGFASLIVGRFRGGLAYVNIIASVIFAGMSGSALADAAGPGKISIDMMIKAGYRPGFAAALTSTSAILGPIIPPSIPMVLYGVVTNTSIGYLFLGGVGPGLFLAAVMMGLVAIQARIQDFPTQPKPTLKEAIVVTRDAGPTLLLPAILLGGIYTGAVTPTEAAAVAAFVALVLAIFWYRTMSPKKLFEVLLNSSKSTAIVGITIAGAVVMNYIVAAERLPAVLGVWIAEMDMGPRMFMFVVTLLFILLGALFDTLLLLLIVIPILMPTVRDLGIDPVYFGVVSTVNMMIGLIHPPMGQVLYLISGITGIKVGAILREIWVLLALMVISLFVLVFIPQITLWLPKMAGYVPAGGFH
ncbi:TRAP transporter large permease [Mesorhizobium sp. BH1-1-5]|uniref:TRAP transporter large permease n=1 Tax=Mesorhizobium sp. BH1-1-5 TaxID=2876661 RepID=UPI001CCA6A02|nr:TRAP transporter large permease [Mesorhizobium sp. BH1-1-5]MBZ9991519.1 TRAP transporter large permease [Mesorhizobium sp. BH1-1-5]